MFQSMIESFNDPHARHAILVHFPIVLGMLSPIPVALLAIKGFRSTPLTITSLAWFLAATIALGLASGAGEEAYESVERTTLNLTQAEEDALEEHESLGEGAWLWALPGLASATLVFVPKKPIRIVAGVLLLASSATLAGFVAITGHTGGKLVYTHGLGVPVRGQTNISPPNVETHHDEHDDD